MKTPILSIVLACLFLFSLQAQNVPKSTDIEFYIEKGDSLKEAENKGENARVFYRKALHLDPGHAMTYHKIGQSFVRDYSNEQLDRYIDSVTWYENKARTIDPMFKDAYVWEVASYRAKWRHAMSRKVLMNAIQHLPEDPNILMLMGRNYFDTGNPGLALPYLEKSIELGGDNAPGVAYRFAGWCWFYLEDHEKQLDYFNQFREIDPKSLMGIAGQIHSYTGFKNFEKATRVAKQIKEENPEYAYPAFLEAFIGETLLFGGNFEEAIPYYEKAMEMDSKVSNLFASRSVSTTLGYIYMQSQREKEGRELLNQTLERMKKNWEEMPERWEFSFDIASAYAALGEFDKAYQWMYTSVITGYPGHLWKMDPVFSACHNEVAFLELVKQARIRVENEYEWVKRND